MEKKFCRKVDITNYEYFTYDGTEEGTKKLYDWVKTFDTNSEMWFIGKRWRIFLSGCDFCFNLPEYPCLILHPIGRDELLFVSPDYLGRVYEILPTDYFDEDRK